MQSNKDKTKGIIGTVIFHSLLLLVLIFFGLSTTLPLPEEQGIEVNLGKGFEGMGNYQPEKPSVIKQSVPVEQASDSKEDKILSQDTEEAPALNNIKDNKSVKSPSDKKETEKEKEPQVNPDALYKGKSKDKIKNMDEGETDKPGDQGVPTGSEHSKNYEGIGGSGKGISYNLSGRNPKYIPKPLKKFSENGTVAVQITVDKYGKVIKAVAIDKGSNTTNITLRNLAVQAAYKAIFNANPDAPEEQKGTITYHFEVRN
ncbi:MAG: energy transducer TonB [Bacteroidales bacterium]|nr:energy transducer TonB [Bacteroidales bacterium]